ncbi:hypothetical protein E2F46_00435 [Luteimonas aestuarii]|uniref:Uncharacterized protein n=1 Tax=Luteimonas aestuarii TaxID=453837 RepID=A0A4R5U3X4_9GAMM|nr:hypothetical protein [Luteimonas aestuarii]TDK28397.1 hypothetical protein E2F46_00435 [Luteimonas aestuarii]
MVDANTRTRRRVQVPLPVAILVPLVALLSLLWAFALAFDRNPLPFPDRHYHVFSASSGGALVAMEDIMRPLGVRPRFRIDSGSVQRTLFSNGTIVNRPDPLMYERLGPHGAALGFVVADPDASAREVAARLRERGFAAESVHDAEPGLPIAFVRTDALVDSVLVFRKHVLRMGARPDPWTPRSATGD